MIKLINDNVEGIKDNSEKKTINIDKDTIHTEGGSTNNNKAPLTYLVEGKIKYHCNAHLKAIKQMRHHQTCRVSVNVATIACTRSYSVEILARESEREINS